MSSRTNPGRVIILALLTIGGMLGASVAGITWWLRADLHQQILHREGEALHAVALMQQALEQDRAAGWAEGTNRDRLVFMALQISRLRGVLGAKVFDRAGEPLESMPTTLQLIPPGPQEWKELQAMKPVVRYNPAGSLGGLYGLGADPRELAPLLDIIVPLGAAGTAEIDGAAHYVIDGGSLEREFQLLDRRLMRQAGLVWLLTTGVSTAGVGWMIQRLARANMELRARTDDLVRANRELALAAKTSALGALTAHLMHGLRNPIAGLEAFLREQREKGSPAPKAEWSEATAAALRVKDMVDQLVDLMRDEHSGVAFELTGREVLEAVASRLAALASRRKISVTLTAESAGKLTNHQAGLVTAILTNLAQNACEALPPGAGTVVLKAKSPSGGEMEFIVEDNGPGLPLEARDRPFEPRQSSKPEGAGIGLAICRQLAAHLGGRLVLTATNSAGTSFSLLIPESFSLRE